MPSIDEILFRLASTAPGTRRLAIFDLIRLTSEEPRAMQVLLNHLPGEPDEKAALATIRHLAAAGEQSARPVLWALYKNQETPARIAHAAVVAHDELVARASSP